MKKHRNMEFRTLLLELASLLEPHTYVEIGVKRGYTFNEMAKLVKRAVAVDLSPMSLIDLPSVEKYQMSSSGFAKVWKDPIDFLFIDGDHEYTAVLEDTLSLSKFLTLHTGLAFLHDTYPVQKSLLAPGYCNDAWRAAKLLHRNQKTCRRFEVVTIPGPWAGLTILRRVEKSHGWMDSGQI